MPGSTESSAMAPAAMTESPIAVTSRPATLRREDDRDGSAADPDGGRSQHRQSAPRRAPGGRGRVAERSADGPAGGVEAVPQDRLLRLLPGRSRQRHREESGSGESSLDAFETGNPAAQMPDLAAGINRSRCFLPGLP